MQSIYWDIQAVEKWHATKDAKMSTEELQARNDLNPVITQIQRLKPQLVSHMLASYEKCSGHIENILQEETSPAGKDANMKISYEKFRYESYFIGLLRDLENWQVWQVSPNGYEELQKFVTAKEILSREAVNRFIKTASAHFDLVWENPILSNIFHDIILFAARTNLLDDITSLHLVQTGRTIIPKNSE